MTACETFECRTLQVHYGDSVKLVGSAPELGDWDLDRAPELSWGDGDVWTTSVELPPGSEVHFKVWSAPPARSNSRRVQC